MRAQYSYARARAAGLDWFGEQPFVALADCAERPVTELLTLCLGAITSAATLTPPPTPGLDR